MNPKRLPLDGALSWKKALGPIFLALFLIQALHGHILYEETSRNTPRAPSEFWYIVKVGGTIVGYLREEQKSAPPDKIPSKPENLITETEMHIVLNRIGSRVELRSFSITEENSEGRLLSARLELQLSNQTMITEASIKEGAIELRSEAGGRPYTRTIEYKGELFGPEGIRLVSKRGLRKTGDTIAVQTFVAEASLVTTASRTVLGRETLEIAETPAAGVEGLKIEETLQGLPTKRTIWLDEEGFILRQEEPGPFGVIEVVRSDKTQALRAASGGELPVEIYQRSIVRANIRLPKARPIDRLKVRLSHRNPELGWPDMNRPGQKVVEKTEKSLILEIERTRTQQGGRFPLNLTEQNRLYLEPNAYLQSDDADIKSLASKVVGQEKDAFRAALLLERWVAENMTFDLGFVFAPATEILRDRRATCVGYAILLATLARASGIPSRVVLGYVYALGMFGGHAWTEILAGEEWLPLDAAIVNEGAADATRIGILSSSLADGPGEFGLGSAQQVFGQIDIRILEYEIDGKVHPVPEDAEPYRINGNKYENPWLGVKLEKPEDFDFTRLDAVWPDRTVVAMESAGGGRASLEEHEVYPWQDRLKEAHKKLRALIPGGRELKIEIASGQTALVLVNPENSRGAFALCRGIEVFILRIEQADSLSLLHQLAKSLHIKPMIAD